MGSYKDLLQTAFKYQGANPASPPAPAPTPFVPQLEAQQKKTYNTRDSVSRDEISAETAANAQALIWGNGNVPPPKPPKAPPAKMMEQGVSKEMKKEEGWGKV